MKSNPQGGRKGWNPEQCGGIVSEQWGSPTEEEGRERGREEVREEEG